MLSTQDYLKKIEADGRGRSAVVARLGDMCAEDHGGGAVVCTSEGQYYLEWTQGLESEHPGEDRYGDDDEVGALVLEVFRVQLDEPAIVALSGHGDEVKLWTGIAKSVDMDAEEVLKLARSEATLEIAGAFEMYAGHWGWRELDWEPLRLPYREVESRWEES